MSDDDDGESQQKFSIMEASNAKSFGNLDANDDPKKTDIEDRKTPQDQVDQAKGNIEEKKDDKIEEEKKDD